LRFRRGTAPLADYENTVRAGIVKGEERHVPVEFWTETDAGTMGRLAAELGTTGHALKLHTVSSASAGAGRSMSLDTALEEVGTRMRGLDPFTSTNALRGGLYQSPAGREILKDMVPRLGLEATGGASLLVSQVGVVTKCHFHAPPVLNIFFYYTFLAEGEVRIQLPGIGAPSPVAKRYVLFDTRSLEAAGIPCFDCAAVVDLKSLVCRIAGLPSGRRALVRWFDCSIDGTDSNALYMPSTMTHHVSTERVGSTAEDGLYFGLATEVFPTDAGAREAVWRTLQVPSPFGPAGTPVACLKHIAGQSTSRYTLDLLRRLVETPGAMVTQFPTWYDA
jgi:hypothetical protein